MWGDHGLHLSCKECEAFWEMQAEMVRRRLIKSLELRGDSTPAFTECLVNQLNVRLLQILRGKGKVWS